MTTVHPIPDDALGNTSYLVDVGDGLAAAVDPRREAETYVGLADRLGLRLVASLETHLHADFVSGSRELADAAGAEIFGSADAGLGFGHTGLRHGQTVALGEARFRVLATPGHTPEHVAYVLEGEDGPEGVFSGGSLIAGGAARTDLTGADHTEALARAQFQSLRAVADLPDAAMLWPTHGAGSFCSAGPGGMSQTTIGVQRRANPLVCIDDEDEFVHHLVAGFGSYPPYFLHLRSVNQGGPALLRDLAAPHPMAALEVAERVDAGAWLVDARPVEAWAAGHPRGSVSNAHRAAFASWLGWIVPFGAPIVLVIEEERATEAVALAHRIGYDAVLGWLAGGLEAWESAGLPIDTVEVIEADEAGRRVEAGATLLDVRQESELVTARIPGAAHLELGDIIAGKVPEADRVVTFCGHGERSATAASLLERRGVAVASLNGGLPAWERAGLPVDR